MGAGASITDPVDIESVMAKEEKNVKLSDKYPGISDTYHYSELLLKDTCVALYGIIEQDIKLGKKELLKDSKFIQGRFYETMTYIMSRQEKDLDQVLLEYSIPRLKYVCGGSTVVEPQIDVMLVKRNPDLVFVTAIVMTKPAAAYRPDVRSVRSDMARLAYMVLERIVRWGFYLWVGTLDELRNMELTKNFKELCAAEGTVESQIVFRTDTLLLPRVGKPLPSSFTKTLLVNRLSGNFCLRLYRIEPEITMWEERDDDVERLIEYYRNKTLQNGYGLWGVEEQIKNIRRQLKKVRDYIDAALFDRARATLMMARVMFTDLVLVKTMDQEETLEVEYLKMHIDKMKANITGELKKTESSNEDETES